MSSNILIIYQPGFGGLFLKFLFSLDPCTSPKLSITDDVYKRLELYDFGNAKKYNHYSKFHKTCDRVTDLLPINTTAYKFNIECTHAYKSRYITKMKVSDLYVVNLSYNDFPNYWLVSTKERLGNFPVLREGEFEDEAYLRARYTPKEINIDCFLDPLHWENEYIRVSTMMGIPLQLDAARKLYQSWYDVRVLPLINDFKTVPNPNFYLSKRKEQEQKELECWPLYETVRGKNWPDCSSEQDFDLLPNWIKKELIEKFNYKPIVKYSLT